MVKMLSRIEHENRSPWVLVRLSLNKVLVPGAGAGASGLSYHKLPKSPFITLSVLKLDGSSFCIEVSKNVTVAGIKLALEDVFGYLPQEDQCQISWSDIWGHFCLCFEGQKLVNDKASIRKLGIKDGDQLEFIQHITLDHRSRKPFQEAQCSWMSQMRIRTGKRQLC